MTETESCCTTEPAPVADSAGPAPAEPTALSGDASGFRTKLILLGTAAGPVFSPGRAGISTALAVGDRHYLVDAGLGAARRLGQAGLRPEALGAVFLTHLHSDHLFDLFNILWMTPGKFGRPVSIYGPGPAGALPEPFGAESVPLVQPDRPTPGTTDLIHGLLSSYAYDMNIRNIETGAQIDHANLFEPNDVHAPAGTGASATHTAPDMQPFGVFEDDRVRVSAILVPHGPVFPSFAFRFDTDDGAVTISGDTAYSDNVGRLASGSDVLVHEAIDVDWFARTAATRKGFGPGFLHHMEAAHTTPQDVGKIATAASVKHVVLSHIGPGDPRAVPDERWRDGVSATYSGPVTPGHDLTAFGIGTKL